MKKIIEMEIFPTSQSCAAGCSLCPLSRREDVKNTGSTNPEVLASYKLFEEIMINLNISHGMVYAGPVQDMQSHISNLVSDFSRFKTLRYGFDPKDAMSFAELLNVTKEQLLGLENHSKEFKLESISGTFYPKDAFRMTKEESELIYDLLALMRELKIYTKKRIIEVEVHSNMVPYKSFNKELMMIEARQSRIYNQVLYKILETKDFPKLVQKKFTLMQYIAPIVYNSLLMDSFPSDRNLKMFVHGRMITIPRYPKEMSKKDINIHQANQLINSVKLDGIPSFSFTPEGIMFHHSSLYVNNPVIWVSHEEFRDLLKEHGTSTDALHAMELSILKQNLEFLKAEKNYIAPAKSMKKFAAMRKELLVPVE
ncbi:MAG: hypothetical protein JWM20_566 [Patescibacteria group bacterium]|nr:hypothetical protein [Patescibacteria group bacterium]